MEHVLSDPRSPLRYSPKFREYQLFLRKTTSIYGLLYCPWCGTKLPEDVRDQYYDLLINTYKIDPYDHAAENFPQEFTSDEWWKKRGL